MIIPNIWKNKKCSKPPPSKHVPWSLESPFSILQWNHEHRMDLPATTAASSPKSEDSEAMARCPYRCPVQSAVEPRSPRIHMQNGMRTFPWKKSIVWSEHISSHMSTKFYKYRFDICKMKCIYTTVMGCIADPRCSFVGRPPFWHKTISLVLGWVQAKSDT